MDDVEVPTSSDDPFEGYGPSYDGPGIPAQEDRHSDRGSEDSLSLVSSNSSIASSLGERRLGLLALKGLGWSGLKYDDYE